MMSTNDRLFLSLPVSLSRAAFCSIRKAVLLAALAFVYSAADAERSEEKRREKNKEKKVTVTHQPTPLRFLLLALSIQRDVSLGRLLSVRLTCLNDAPVAWQTLVSTLARTHGRGDIHSLMIHGHA